MSQFCGNTKTLISKRFAPFIITSHLVLAFRIVRLILIFFSWHIIPSWSLPWLEMKINGRKKQSQHDNYVNVLCTTHTWHINLPYFFSLAMTFRSIISAAVPKWQQRSKDCANSSWVEILFFWSSRFASYWELNMKKTTFLQAHLKYFFNLKTLSSLRLMKTKKKFSTLRKAFESFVIVLPPCLCLCLVIYDLLISMFQTAIRRDCQKQEKNLN